MDSMLCGINVPLTSRLPLSCRNQGALRTLFAGVETVLPELSVQHLVVASILPLKRMGAAEVWLPDDNGGRSVCCGGYAGEMRSITNYAA
jgi:hypothetical protein